MAHSEDFEKSTFHAEAGEKTLSAPAEKNKDVEDTASIATASTKAETDNPIGPPQDPIEPVPTESSNIQRELHNVPRNQRRGLLARFSVVPEVTNPYDYSRHTKWFITFVTAVAGAAAPMGSSIVLPALVDIGDELHAAPAITNLSVAFYMLSLSIFPLWWSSFSETLGRRSIYIASFVLCIAFGIGSALARDIATFIVMRCLSGGAGASVQAVGAGTIADVWETKERGRAMGIFYIGPLCGPLFAPIVGGALTQSLGWRSTQWFLVIYCFCVLVFIVLVLPETLERRKPLEEAVTPEEQPGARPGLQRTSTRQSVQLQTKRWIVLLRRCFVDPFAILLYLRYPAIIMVVYYASITFGTLYFLNISIQDSFSRPPYSFSTLIVGLLYIPNSFGYFLASIFGGRWIDRIMHREARKAGRFDEKGKLIFIPEDRMKENAWISAIVYPAALIWYGWTVQYGKHWIIPMIANFFFGVGSMLVFALATTMLTEFMPRKSSSGIALNNFVRNIFSCVGTLASEPAIRGMGNGWLFTFLGLLCFVSGVGVLLAMRRWGLEWRKSMDEKMAHE